MYLDAKGVLKLPEQIIEGSKVQIQNYEIWLEEEKVNIVIVNLLFYLRENSSFLKWPILVNQLRPDQQQYYVNFFSQLFLTETGGVCSDQ